MSDLKPSKTVFDGSLKYQRLLAGAPQTAGMKSGHMSLQPGESVGEHKTEAKEEAIIILEGTAEVLIEGAVSLVAGRDTLVYIPPQTNHDVRNAGQSVLRYVYVVAPVRP